MLLQRVGLTCLKATAHSNAAVLIAVKVNLHFSRNVANDSLRRRANLKATVFGPGQECADYIVGFSYPLMSFGVIQHLVLKFSNGLEGESQERSGKIELRVYEHINDEPSGSWRESPVLGFPDAAVCFGHGVLSARCSVAVDCASDAKTTRGFG